MSHRTAAIAFAFGLALATGGVAHAQTTPATPSVELPSVKVTEGGSMVSMREIAAIGTGVVVGAALWHVVIGHGFMLAGAAIGGWVGDWFYGTHMAPPPARIGG